MNLNLIRPKNEIKDRLLPTTETCKMIKEHTHTKPQ